MPEELAIVAAHATQRGTRVLHLYSDGHGPARELVDRFAAACGTGAVVQWDLDPAWAAIRPFQ